MKTILCFLILGFSYNPDTTGNATVSKIQGIEIYVYSQPTKDYKVIDSGKVSITLTGSCSEGITQAVKKASKAGADAVIYDLNSSRWEAIRYE